MRYCAKIGFRWTDEERLEDGTPTSVWKEFYAERTYKADVMSNGYRNQQGEGINDDYKINNKLSLLACDAFTLSHLNSVIFCELYGVKWKVTSVDIQRPRLIVTLGGEYHEQTAET